MTRARGKPPGLLKEIGHAAWRVTAKRGALLPLCTASCALRPCLYAYCSGCRSASKIGDNMSTAAVSATLSRIVDIPNGRFRPSGFAM